MIRMFDFCVVYVLVCTQHGLRDCYVPRTKNTTQYCDGTYFKTVTLYKINYPW